MDGFKNSTKVQYMKGGSCEGYAKGGKVKGAAKINKVMGEFKRGELHSGSKEGPKVTSKKQATAIALSEARKAGAKIPMKKAGGGRAVESTSARPKDKQGRPITDKQLRQANRDTGGMSAKQVKAAGEAIARGNRTPYEPIPTDAEAARMMSPYKRGGGVKPYNSQPLIGKGGLSAMPHGKKC